MRGAAGGADRRESLGYNQLRGRGLPPRNVTLSNTQYHVKTSGQLGFAWTAVAPTDTGQSTIVCQIRTPPCTWLSERRPYSLYIRQWHSHTSGVRGVRTPCQENT